MDLLVHDVGLIPLLYTLGGVASPLLRFYTKRGKVYAVYSLIIALLALVFSIRTLVYVEEFGTIVYPFGGWPPPLGIVYVVDFLNAVYGLLATALFFFIALYNIWYFDTVSDASWLSMLLLLCMAGVTGCIYTGDIFNFFVMLEVLAISSYSLVAFFKKRKWALEASLSYAFIGAIATSFFFFGAIFLYAGLGSLNIADIAAKVNGLRADGLYVWSGGCIDSQCFGNVLAASAMAIAFMLWALTFEAGIFPNNYWLPSAYTEAPSPASALFAGIVDKVGTYGIIRLFVTMFTPYSTALMIKLLGIPFRDLVLYILSVLGLATGFIGALIMILQNDIKRLLSYSTISHIGLIFMAFAALTSATPEVAASIALMGIVFHSITHALGESMLFMGLGALATFAKSRKLKDLQGYGKLYPAISIAVGVGALSLLGVPPLGGFFSKYALFMALSSANLWIYAVSIVLVSGISAIGYFKVLYALFMQKPTITKRGGSSVIVSAVCILMAVALLFVGILYMNGELYEVLYRGCSDVLPPKGLKGYVYAVEEAARVLGMTP